MNNCMKLYIIHYYTTATPHLVEIRIGTISFYGYATMFLLQKSYTEEWLMCKEKNNEAKLFCKKSVRKLHIPIFLIKAVC